VVLVVLVVLVVAHALPLDLTILLKRPSTTTGFVPIINLFLPLIIPVKIQTMSTLLFPLKEAKKQEITLVE